MHLDRRLFDGKVISSRVYPECFPIRKDETVVNLGCGLAPQAVVYKGSFKKMVGVDLMPERLEASKVLLAEKGVTDYETVCAAVENTGLPESSFDKALAIDIIEHLPEPMGILDEAYRLLKPGGELLVSVPAMHDRYVHGIKFIGRLFGRKSHYLPAGHLDAHNTDIPLRKWLALMKKSKLQIVSYRATTLFPPLHLFGVPRFWFTNPIIHAIDTRLCRIPGLRRVGQSVLVVLKKPA
jgi:2-polyprenyl-3-methyl-5-hydroxy-6-metoxy-1,4-benzoquinol methylase